VGEVWGRDYENHPLSPPLGIHGHHFFIVISFSVDGRGGREWEIPLSLPLTHKGGNLKVGGHL